MLKNILCLFEGGALDILWAVLILLFTAALIVGLFFRAKRDRLYFIDISEKKRLYTVKEFEKSLDISIKLKSKFYLYMLYAREYKDLSALHTKALLDDTMEKTVDRLEAEAPQGVRICYFGEGRILVYIKENKQINVDAFAKSAKETASRKTSLANKQTITIDYTVVLARFPADGTTLTALLENMGIALSDSKRSISGSSTPIYNSAVLAPQQKDAKEIDEIKNAIKNNEFVLYYQPIVERKTMETIGAECLIRWQHPKKGLIPPSAFLPVLERTGEIYSIGIWTFEEACKQLNLWRKDAALPKIWLSLNMSIMQLSKPEIVKEFTKFLRKYDLEAQDFYFEIYDMTLYSSMSGIKDTIDRLAGMGFKISVDKFGRGKTSLTELEKFPLSQIKVDMPFLLHAKENVLYSGIINALNDYVRQNDIMMIADGVETQDNLEWAKLYGINYMQGFYFAKPSAADAFTDNALKKAAWKSFAKGSGTGNGSGSAATVKNTEGDLSAQPARFIAPMERTAPTGGTGVFDRLEKTGGGATAFTSFKSETSQKSDTPQQDNKETQEKYSAQKRPQLQEEERNSPSDSDNDIQPIKLSQSRLAQAAGQGQRRKSLSPNAACLIGDASKPAPITIGAIPTRVDTLKDEDE